MFVGLLFPVAVIRVVVLVLLAVAAIVSHRCSSGVVVVVL